VGGLIPTKGMIKYNKNFMNKVKVRIAPSPTGNLHVGTARSAIFNWLYAKHNNGEFIVRIEDTDTERSKKEYEDNILDGFKWLGLDWDRLERQSERTEIYKKYLRELLENKKAFWCYHSKTELMEEKEGQMVRKEPPRHICSHKNNPPSELPTDEGIIRLNVSEKEGSVSFEDMVRGEVVFQREIIGDISIAKNENSPLYNFAVVVDDHEMEISDVIRGEDHIPNTPKQILIYEALGFDIPNFAHIPLILGEDKSKLSKRHGAVSIFDYKEEGFLAESMFNFLSLLGWSPKNDVEIMSKEEIIDIFYLDGIQKSGAVFDIKKFKWMNGEYIKKMDLEELKKEIDPFLNKHFGSYEKDILDKSIGVIQERVEIFDQAKEFHFIFKDIEYESDLLVWKKSDILGAKKSLETILKLIEQDFPEEINIEKLKEKLDGISQSDFAGDRGAVYWPLRVALSGEKFSPDPIQLTTILGKEKTIKRIKKAIDKI